MKKALSLLLALVLCLALCACGNDPVETENNGSSTETTQGATEETEASNVMGAEVLKFTLLSDKTYAVAASEELYALDDIHLVIPSEYNGKAVTVIEEDGFKELIGLVSVTIPDSVTTIGLYAFNSCNGLTSIVIGSGVTHNFYAFRDCPNITQITVSDDNPIYHSSGNCIIETESKTLVLVCSTSIIPNDGSVTTIGQNAFIGCTGPTSITIPNSVTEIDQSAFASCTSLTSVTISGSLTTSVEAFAGCYSLTSVTILDGMTHIDWGMFRRCAGLTSVTIPDSVTGIGIYAFEDCIR